MKKLVYIGFAFQHHKGTHSGYHQIKEHVGYDYIIDVQKYMESYWRPPKNFFDKIIRGLVYRIVGTPVIPFYILKCVILGLLHKNLVFHFIYGENTYYNISPFIRKSNQLVCTFHQPADWFENKKEKWYKRLGCLNKIILVSEKEIHYFKTKAAKAEVKYIPHGIDTIFYSPDSNIHKSDITKILTVGNWLRDYAFAAKVYNAILERRPKTKITIVSKVVKEPEIINNEHINITNGINDNDLRALYRNSDCFFLPLKRFTANNSLLEAAACGCNIVIASDHDDNSYIPSELIDLCPLDVDVCVDMILKMLEQRSNNLSLSNYVDKEYGWQIVGNITERFLKTD